jgi:predicted dithiol-disulfide oxidoreductase (DUF899 family)
LNFYRTIAAKAKERGWFAPWYSTFGSDFNYDFQVTPDSSRGRATHVFRMYLTDASSS